MDGKAVNEMKKTRDKNILNSISSRFPSFRNMREYIFKNFHGVTCPINLNRLIHNIKTQFGFRAMLSDLNPVYVINQVNKLTVDYVNDECSLASDSSPWKHFTKAVD